MIHSISSAETYIKVENKVNVKIELMDGVTCFSELAAKFRFQ